MKVFICSHVDPYYSSFYIYGLEQLFGKKNIFYTIKGFEDILPNLWEVYMAFIIEDDNESTKYVIDSNDFCSIKEEVYEWCDVYGHCNANFTKYSKDKYSKLVTLCPSFGIRCWNFWKTIWYCCSNICKLHFHVPSYKKYIWRYFRQFQRRPYSEYTNHPIPIMENYIYSCNTLWYNTANTIDNDTGVNYVRTQFFDACRETSDILFEGGLVPTNRSKKQMKKFTKYLTHSVSAKVYLTKIKQSMLVFNTPAFWDCHGWKLGEYMALGKCIITTPISNELPIPVTSNSMDDKSWIDEYFYVVDKNKNSMKDAILFIQHNPLYREKLETNIAKYWADYGTPIASLKRLGISC